MNEQLEALRRGLDEIDGRLIAALAQRQRLVAEVAGLKTEGMTFLRDVQREEELLARALERGRGAGLDGYFVTRLFREILDHSVRQQTQRLVERQNPQVQAAPALVVAFQGTEGAYSHLAAQKHFGPRGVEARCVGFDSFQEMLEAVRDGEADFAMLPIENTTAGSINTAYDLLARMNLALVGEEVQRVDHCLLAVADVPLSHIRRVYSHPQALEQCSDFLRSLRHVQVEAFTDTAMAARRLRDEQDLSDAAIASEQAAQLYGLHVLKRGIANNKDNFTRFVVAAREPIRVDARIPCKTSIIFATRDEEGALLRCLNVLHAAALNMTKLESRPRPNTPWEYLFYVDFQGNLADPRVEQAMRSVAAHTSFLKVLGSYPARTTRETRPATPAREKSPSRTATATGETPSSRAATVTTDTPSSRAATVRERVDAEISTAPQTEKAAPPTPPAAPPGLEKKPYKLVSRAQRAEDSRIRVGEVTVGGGRPVVIAGPCSVESREQIFACAKAARECGADLLRGGCFKPRTSPYAFQGLGYAGLDLLAEAGQAYGLPVVTEVMHPADVEAVARRADALQIGARNMQNFSLLKEIGRVDRPVVLKRGLMASIDEWLGAAEYILAHGNQQVILCERGIRTFETATRNTLDLSAVPVARELTHLPIIVDPSHACGTWRWIPAMSRAALAVGADGIMIEIHPDPDKALSDGPQALTFDTFRELMQRLHVMA